MKRIFITAVAASSLACALPATALAHHHHARHHSKRHAHKARILQFGSVSDSSTDPSSPTRGAPSSDITIGTITGWENGVLTITLNGNPTPVSGKVTPDTEFACEHEGSSYGAGGDQTPGSSGAGDQSSSATGQVVTQHSANLRASISQNQDQGDCDDGSCGVESLAKGVAVVEADLKMGSAGPEWEKVETVH